MDELFELRLRRGLENLIEPVSGEHPRWESSPAAGRVALERRRDRWALPVRQPRLAWVLVAAALLLALLATLGVVGSPGENARPTLRMPAVVDPARPLEERAVSVDRHPQPVWATGIEILSADHGDYGAAVLDADGETIWLLSDRGLTWYDPAKGTAQAWTAANDPAFPRWKSGSIVRAGSGGVWLVGDAFRLFDGGARFLDVVPVPGQLAAATEAPDGTLWSVSPEGAVHHRVGSVWTEVPSAWSGTTVATSIAVDTAGGVWVGAGPVGFPSETPVGWVARYDGGAWTTYDGDDAGPLGAFVRSITPLADGSVWVATDAGLASFDGARWTTVLPAGNALRMAASVGAGSDGAIWVAAGDLDTGAVTAGRSNGRTWTTWGPADGLPESQGWITVSVLPTHDATYIAAGGGLFRLDVDRWTRAWPRTIAPGPTWITSLLPLSAREAYAGDGGVWHLVDGAWTLEWPLTDPDGRVSDLEVLDGGVWAATTEGVLLRSGGRSVVWAIVDRRPAGALAAAADGSLWVGGTSGDDALWRLVREGDEWVARDVPDPPDMRAVNALAMAPDGTAWAGVRWWDRGGIARFDGGTWITERPLGETGEDQAPWQIVATPGGDVWVVVNDTLAQHDGERWTTYRAGSNAPHTGWHSLSVGPDGAVWGASKVAGPVRFDGADWRASGPSVSLDGIWLAPDGSVWGSFPDGIARLAAGMTGE